MAHHIACDRREFLRVSAKGAIPLAMLSVPVGARASNSPPDQQPSDDVLADLDKRVSRSLLAYSMSQIGPIYAKQCAGAPLTGVDVRTIESQCALLVAHLHEIGMTKAIEERFLQEPQRVIGFTMGPRHFAAIDEQLHRVGVRAPASGLSLPSSQLRGQAIAELRGVGSLPLVAKNLWALERVARRLDDETPRLRPTAFAFQDPVAEAQSVLDAAAAASAEAAAAAGADDATRAHAAISACNALGMLTGALGMFSGMYWLAAEIFAWAVFSIVAAIYSILAGLAVIGWFFFC